MSTAGPDLSLLKTALPDIDKYLEHADDSYPFALYTLVALSDTELLALQTACESECLSDEPGDNVLLAPQPNFTGKSLQAVFDSHLKLGLEDVYHPLYFIVAIEKDWEEKGVLLVTLDSEEGEGGKPDCYRTKVGDSGLTLVNLRIANSDWEESKENYEIGGSGDKGEDEDEDEE